MRELMLLASVLILTVPAAGPAEDKSQQEAVAKALKELEGTWEVEKLVRNGEEIPAPAGKKRFLVIDKTTYVLKVDDQKADQGTFAVNPAGKPATIDVIPGRGEAEGKNLLGIYELRGDTLRVCIAGPNKERPKSFESKADSGITFGIYRRAKK
jgi:uncharacterized protein (TIGR03067 family)